jgi:predicted amidophosphoribosyltransferase
MHDYYRENGVREICHKVKEEKDTFEKHHAVMIIANDLLSRNLVHKGDFLIPAPQHKGRAEYTRDIAEIIAMRTGAYICDILRCEPHRPLYEQKVLDMKPELKMRICGGVPAAGRLFFVDNVIDTGLTFREADRLLGNRLIPLIYAENREKDAQIVKDAL